MRIPRRLLAYLAFVLGVLGSVIAVVCAAVIVWLGATASNIVDDVVETITTPIDRLDTRLTETTEAVAEADGPGELRARSQGVADLAVNARESLDAIDEHPLFGRLPVDTSRVSSVLERVEQSALEAGDDLGIGDGAVSATVKGQITDRLSAAKGLLASVDEEIEDLGNSLRLWILVAALGGLLLCLWGLWAQVALARFGWRGRRPGHPRRVEERAGEQG